jgi:hypothetical protein
MKENVETAAAMEPVPMAMWNAMEVLTMADVTRGTLQASRLDTICSGNQVLDP